MPQEGFFLKIKMLHYKCYITPLPPPNSRQAATVTFLSPQGRRCEEVRLHYIVLLYPLLRRLAANLTQVINDGKILNLLLASFVFFFYKYHNPLRQNLHFAI